MIRALRQEDFAQVCELAKPYMDDRLRFSAERSRAAMKRLLSDATCFTAGELSDGRLTGAIAVMSSANAFAEKRNASLVFWFGAPKLLRLATEWADQRPAIRATSIAFTHAVDPRVYRYLNRLGYTREGDLMVKWR